MRGVFWKPAQLGGNALLRGLGDEKERKEWAKSALKRDKNTGDERKMELSYCHGTGVIITFW